MLSTTRNDLATRFSRLDDKERGFFCCFLLRFGECPPPSASEATNFPEYETGGNGGVVPLIALRLVRWLSPSRWPFSVLLPLCRRENERLGPLFLVFSSTAGSVPIKIVNCLFLVWSSMSNFVNVVCMSVHLLLTTCLPATFTAKFKILHWLCSKSNWRFWTGENGDEGVELSDMESEKQKSAQSEYFSKLKPQQEFTQVCTHLNACILHRIV